MRHFNLLRRNQNVNTMANLCEIWVLTFLPLCLQFDWRISNLHTHTVLTSRYIWMSCRWLAAQRSHGVLLLRCAILLECVKSPPASVMHGWQILSWFPVFEFAKNAKQAGDVKIYLVICVPKNYQHSARFHRVIAQIKWLQFCFTRRFT